LDKIEHTSGVSDLKLKEYIKRVQVGKSWNMPPPVELLHVPGQQLYKVINWNHRIAAARFVGKDSISAVVKSKFDGDISIVREE
jgi:hypothetical protein